jgi:hypothetical protein
MLLLSIVKHVFTQARNNARKVGCHKYQCALTSWSLIFTTIACTTTTNQNLEWENFVYSSHFIDITWVTQKYFIQTFHNLNN